MVYNSNAYAKNGIHDVYDSTHTVLIMKLERRHWLDSVSYISDPANLSRETDDNDIRNLSSRINY